MNEHHDHDNSLAQPPEELFDLLEDRATFGLGESSYPKYNYAAMRLHRRLAMLGATPLGSCAS